MSIYVNVAEDVSRDHRVNACEGSEGSSLQGADIMQFDLEIFGGEVRAGLRFES